MGKRQALYTAVKTRLALINGAGGYHTSVGSDIRDWQLTPLEKTDIDCLLLYDRREVEGAGENKNSAGINRVLEIDLKAVIAEAAASPEKARQVEEDLFQAIRVDETWGGLARRTELGTSEIAVDDKGARIGGLDFSIRIEFGRARWEVLSKMTISIVNNTDLVSFQGKLYEAVRDANGLPAGFRWVGNASDVKFSLAQEEVEHRESYSGNRLIDGILNKPGKATLSFILSFITKGNAEMAFQSTQVSNAGTGVTGETQATLAVGDFIFSKHGNITSLVITDSAGSPATLTLNTHYSLEDAAYGRIKILSLGSFTQPFKLAYTYAQEIIFPFFANQGQERYFRFEGFNTQVSNKKIAVEFYRAKPKPISEFSLIDEEFNKFPIEAGVLSDLTRASDANFLQFGRYIPLE